MGEEYVGEHIEEFVAKGYLEVEAGELLPASSPEDPTGVTPPESVATIPEFDNMTKKEILEYAQQHDIQMDEKLSKKEMIDRVLEELQRRMA